MSSFLQKLDSHLPFNKTERIIIGIVVLLHALPALEFLHWTSKPTKTDDDARVMANLVSPDTANKSQQPPAPPPPLPELPEPPPPPPPP
jgi:protein TonB